MSADWTETADGRLVRAAVGPLRLEPVGDALRVREDGSSGSVVLSAAQCARLAHVLALLVGDQLRPDRQDP